MVEVSKIDVGFVFDTDTKPPDVFVVTISNVFSDKCFIDKALDLSALLTNPSIVKTEEPLTVFFAFAFDTFTKAPDLAVKSSFEFLVVWEFKAVELALYLPPKLIFVFEEVSVSKLTEFTAAMTAVFIASKVALLFELFIAEILANFVILFSPAIVTFKLFFNFETKLAALLPNTVEYLVESITALATALETAEMFKLFVLN